MIRQTLVEHDFAATPHFRWRGRDVSRIEGLSDAVLGFAITLIVVSLEMPRSFDDLLRLMRGVPAFAICFALLLQVWYRHYVYFRRYGLHDLLTVALNGLLLFVILLYVYPLKFLFTLAIGVFSGAGDLPIVHVTQVPLLFTIYGLGFIAIFVTFALLYLRALGRRAALQLDELELFETRLAIVDNLLYASVGLISLLIANTVPLRWVGLAGMTYALLGVVGFSVGWLGGRGREKIVARIRASRQPPAG
ncbi:MAG: hypothetical protein CHACPFDD_03051 [Phycisphaerae bacterium]|nr:hypothetical protein [Phycisphaerae bacterium]